MDRPLPEILRSIDDLVSDLTRRLTEERGENERLRAALAEREEQLAEVRGERDRALLDVEYLTLSHRLADSPDTVVSARRHISRMIRTVDRCISLLKDDPQA